MKAWCCSLLLIATLASMWRVVPATGEEAPPIANFVDIGQKAGLTAKTIIGEENVKRYILESTGGGIAVVDYDGDGWPDIFVTNGWRVGGFPPGETPTNHLYRNNRNGTFTDVTVEVGLARSGWAQGVCAGDYDGDGYTDLYVTYYGRNMLYRNDGRGHFRDVTKEAGLEQTEDRYGTGCTFVDYDRDGKLDLFVTNYVAWADGLRELPSADQTCRWKGLRVFCGPIGLRSSRSYLFRNLGSGKFADVSEASGIARVPPGNGFTVIAADFDNDGWPDLYVANDATPSRMLHNRGNGTFEEIGAASATAYSDTGLEQAGMGVDVADYDGDGLFDLVKTNFSDDIPSLYHAFGKMAFNDEALGSGLQANPHYLGWGVLFTDVDLDGRPDILIANGHVYPGIEKVEHGATYKERKLLYRNLSKGRFQDVSMQSGEAVAAPHSSRGMAAGDLFNRGRLDFVVNNMWEAPSILTNTLASPNHWIEVRLIGVDTNTSAIGSRVAVQTAQGTQFNEVRSGGSFCSQSDFRLYFGLGSAARVERLRVSWLGGKTEEFAEIAADRLLVVRQGRGIVEQRSLPEKAVY
jgi:hypothetical protein